MNILYGLYTPNEGEILLRGKPMTRSNEGGDRARHRHGAPALHVIPVMTVAENIVLATEPRHAAVCSTTTPRAARGASCRSATACS